MSIMMMTPTSANEQYCLKWNNFNTNIVSALGNLKHEEDFVDVTLTCQRQNIKAHKVVLSACSNYFRDVFKDNPCAHPVIILNDARFEDLENIIKYIYRGSVYIPQDDLTSFLKTANSLQVKGLVGSYTEEDEIWNYSTPKMHHQDHHHHHSVENSDHCISVVPLKKKSFDETGANLIKKYPKNSNSPYVTNSNAVTNLCSINMDIFSTMMHNESETVCLKKRKINSSYENKFGSMGTNSPVSSPSFSAASTEGGDTYCNTDPAFTDRNSNCLELKPASTNAKNRFVSSNTIPMRSLSSSSQPFGTHEDMDETFPLVINEDEIMEDHESGSLYQSHSLDLSCHSGGHANKQEKENNQSLDIKKEQHVVEPSKKIIADSGGGELRDSLTSENPFPAVEGGGGGDHPRNRWRCMQPRLCTYCWKTFSNSFNLKQHIVNVHVASTGITCSMCQKIVKNKWYLRKHLVTAHGAPLKRIKAKIISEDIEDMEAALPV